MLRLLPPLVVKPRATSEAFLAALDEVPDGSRASLGMTSLGRASDARCRSDRRRKESRDDERSVKKVVLAYSGGLDTSIIIPWIKENYDGAEIIAYCGDVGQGDDLEAVRKKALATGASEVRGRGPARGVRARLRFKALAAGAVYEDNYLLGTALARPLLAYRQVQVRARARAPTRSPTAPPARATTRCASRSPTRPSRRT